MKVSEKTYSVFVGGSEINAHYLSHDEAIDLAEYWVSKGYDDVVVVNMSTWNNG